MPNKLVDFEVMEISLVKEGAVMENFLTLKQKNGGNSMPDTLVSKIKSETPVEPKAPVAEPIVEAPVVDAKVEPKVEPVVEPVVEPKVEPVAETPVVDVEISKARASLELIQKEKDALQVEVNKFKNAEKVAIYKSKASELNNLNAEGISLHTILQEVDEKLSEEVKKNFNQLLKTVNGLVEGSKMFSEIGKTSTAKTDEGFGSFEELEKSAVSYAQKNKVTKEKAIAILVAQNPSMYEAISKK